MDKTSHSAQPFLNHLTSLSQFLDHQAQCDPALKELAHLIGQTLNSDHCSIMLVKHAQSGAAIRLRLCAHSGTVPQSAYQPSDSPSPMLRYVLESGEPLLVEDIQNSPFAERATSGGGFLSVPLRIDDEIIGIINISHRASARTYHPHDLEIAAVLSLYVAKSLQLLHLEGILHSRFAIAQLAKQPDHDQFNSSEFTRHPEKVARLLARSFFGELSRAGIGNDHIISAISEIITQLNRQMAQDKTSD